MPSSSYAGYRFSRGYINMTVWHFTADGALISTTTCTPKKGLTREQRYDILAAKLREDGLTAAEYKPTEKS